jgi:hypothetical protein
MVPPTVGSLETFSCEGDREEQLNREDGQERWDDDASWDRVRRQR